jgi:hypothetical protein
VGADIVWNFSMPRLGQDPVYFGQGLSADRLVAFAPSCGSCTLDQRIPAYVSEGLRRFHHLSVRDRNTARIVEQASGRNPVIICDPSFHMWEKVQTTTDFGRHGRYILVYLLPGHATQALVSEILALKSKVRLPVYAVYYRHQWADRNIMKCDPFQWLELIRGARYVVTNTFHGTIFAALCRANVVLELNDAIRNKTEDLVQASGLSTKAFGGQFSLMELFDKPIDFDRVFSYVRSEVEVARAYLDKALR